MNSYIGAAFVLLILFPFAVFLPELSVYGVQSTKANNVTEQTTKHAELMGGITPEVKARFQETLGESGLNPANFHITYSTEGKVQHKEKFSVKVTGTFTFKTFNVLGTGIGNIKVPISSLDSGVSEVWIR
ncbi:MULTISPECIES: DUF4320 family protein [Lysinibacillus]|uniref:DUF4320 family protein n=1 Tax=Lysinibacillus TaxID=400634 RepID=UPI000C17F3B9|nr:DUF4320 family protein [Lysinibacillus sphaericus]PIJ95811.1 hypothetical protein CTN02_21865 [Lysinibacillus sphaericus]